MDEARVVVASRHAQLQAIDVSRLDPFAELKSLAQKISDAIKNIVDIEQELRRSIEQLRKAEQYVGTAQLKIRQRQEEKEAARLRTLPRLLSNRSKILPKQLSKSQL